MFFLGSHIYSLPALSRMKMGMTKNTLGMMELGVNYIVYPRYDEAGYELALGIMELSMK